MTFTHAPVENQGDKLECAQPARYTWKDGAIPPWFSARFPPRWFPLCELVEPDPTPVIPKKAMPNNNNKSSFLEWV